MTIVVAPGCDFLIPHNRFVAFSCKAIYMDTRLVSHDPEVMSGALCFTGTRVLVKTLFDYLEGASSLDDFLEDFPSVSKEVAVAVLEAAHDQLVAHAPSA